MTSERNKLGIPTDSFADWSYFYKLPEVMMIRGITWLCAVVASVFSCLLWGRATQPVKGNSEQVDG